MIATRPALFSVIKTVACNGCEIRQTVIRIAYARNGNVDNPTVYYRWNLYRGEKYLGSFRTLTEAKQAAYSPMF